MAENRELWGDDDGPSDPHGLMNSERAYGFDVDCSTRPYRLVESQWGHCYDTDLQAMLGLHCYNFQKGTKFKFECWEKFSCDYTCEVCIYLTFQARDPASDCLISFQTLFSDGGCGADFTIEWRSLACRLKCNERLDDYWDDKALIDEFYMGDMPKWLSDEALAADNKKFYVVQEPDFLENDWLYLYSEIAFYAKTDCNLTTSPRLEVKKVVIETKEEYMTEAREKLKAENAIFYISYKYNGDDRAARGLAGDHRAIVRKTMDGKPGHMCLEVARRTEALTSPGETSTPITDFTKLLIKN
ncbi:Protein MS5 [Arabidopsis thaliana x Arabidopsis arenosa]|uniref:Protein MS5 n=1 Tax=Arabidopsis thaliana x Arabidopsis arenosa TaxID=1240361 RepID=A0A8T1Y113_9BRAS|nr:Protein MS5 [Arabidopsis thaliana x Arabidopsis arenosa]